MRDTRSMKRLVAVFLVFCLIPVFAPGVAAAEPTTLVVAAYDSSEEAKAQASYICDGTSDHVEIQQALDALPAGGTVLLTEGTYACAGNIQPGEGKALQGAGENATVLSYPGNGGLRIRAPSVTFADFKVTGKADMIIENSHARVRNVTMTVDNSRIGAFYVWAANKVVEDTVFENCKAVDCGRYGFLNSGEGTPRLVKDIKYINCEAINCGRDSSVRTGPWVTGFDIVEKNDIDGAEIIGCYAEGNQESGFHLEGFSYLNIKNVRFQDCVSVNNAQKGKDACMFGAGFTVPKGTTLENCTSVNNKHGYLVSGGSVSKGFGNTFVNCTDEASDYGFTIRHGYDCTLTNCESKDAARQGLVLSKAWNIKTENFGLIGTAGYNVHAGSSETAAVKIAGTTASDDQFAYNMWNGQVTDSALDIHAEGVLCDTIVYLENAERVTLTGDATTASADPVRVAGGTAVDTAGFTVAGDAGAPAVVAAA
ncbi:hypothetical protein ABH15_04975 [Methanoculleus taiwanensis]|uniref:Right handed beta helix domain-containing protein n=1 Tax=Methanoculleus taiwanensis TaxID=1550565 RepID=A0A498GZS7_9EURY|nr:right-handed parallel beta-helix repeat-containing protein [Methanoculleus taiwanensis]RXE55614.1 hypothetical protein ABH15_04975 [Methanoculleus taiwanensis]